MVDTTAKSIMQERLLRLHKLVGNTPMIAIHYRLNGKKGRIFVKCEQYNLTGSIKDRMALHILEHAYGSEPGSSGGLHTAQTHIVEATSGNTGISFSALGTALGHKVTIIMPDWLSRERMDIIRALGADIRLISKEEGGFLGCIRMATEMAAADPGVFLPKQFENVANVDAHAKTTGPEIVRQLSTLGLQPDAFIAGVGTGGTVMGVGQHLRSFDPEVCIHPLQPAESPTLTTGYKVGSHRIQGISDEFIPAIIDLSFLNDIVAVSDGDAILMAQRLAGSLGLGVGISSGANFIGAVKLQERMGMDAVVVTVFADSNKKYLSTDLLRAQRPGTGYVTPEVQLDFFEAV